MRHTATIVVNDETYVASSPEFAIEIDAAWNFLTTTWGLYGSDREAYTDSDPSGDRHRQYDRAISIIRSGIQAGIGEWPLVGSVLFPPTSA